MYATSLKSIDYKLNSLKFSREMKKDYYRAFPSTYVYFEIMRLDSQIKALERKINDVSDMY